MDSEIARQVETTNPTTTYKTHNVKQSVRHCILLNWMILPIHCRIFVCWSVVSSSIPFPLYDSVNLAKRSWSCTTRTTFCGFEKWLTLSSGILCYVRHGDACLKIKRKIKRRRRLHIIRLIVHHLSVQIYRRLRWQDGKRGLQWDFDGTTFNSAK